ncbi:extracellular solute-binding protein [Streptomyces sp. NPDC051572]|uniref:extracellular solute-binding protein n=1 Tax=unclassified Streptomyces TaxID=2593676 RepID=UPI00344B5D56
MSHVTRRSVLRSAVVAGAALSAPGLLTACTDGSDGGDVSNTGKKLATWPAYKASAGAKPDIAGSDSGIQPAYTSYPADLTTSVTRTPGDGSVVKVMSVTFGVPPKSESQNQYWKAVEKALGVKIEYTVVPQTDYQKKMATVMAGDPASLPDIINMFSGYTLPREAQFVQKLGTDLTPYLSGDAVADHPNLANIPTHAWRDMGRIGGRIYGVPLERPVPGSTLYLNQTMFTDAGMKEGWTSDDFAAVATKATSGKKYALGASSGSMFGNAVHSAAHRAPQGWSVDSKGTFRSALLDDRWKAAVAFQTQLRKNGSYHPDATSLSTPDLVTLFLNGTVGSLQNGFGAYTSVYTDSKGLMTPTNALPYSVDGSPGGIVAARRSFGYTIIKKAKKERVQMLLRILDYLAAPFGSKEYELVHYGVEGTHFTRGKDGSPEPTKLGETENVTNLPFRYLAEGPQVLFVPGAPNVVRALHAWQQKVVPVAIRNPAFGLQSATNTAQGATLDSMINDAVTAVIAGRSSPSELDSVVKSWRARGGDRMAEEYGAEYALNA